MVQSVTTNFLSELISWYPTSQAV